MTDNEDKTRNSNILESVFFDASNYPLKNSESHESLFPNELKNNRIIDNEKEKFELKEINIKPNSTFLKDKKSVQINKIETSGDVDYNKIKQASDTQISPTKTTKKLIKRYKTIRLQKDENQNIPRNFIDKFKLFLTKYLDHNVELYIMAFLTLFALFGSDIKTLILSSNYDLIFNVVFIFAMILFLLELIASVWVKDKYYKSFIFWLDFLATISMLFELDWVLETIFISLNMKWSLSSSTEDHKDFILQQKVNFKISIILVTIRVIRLVRIVKLYKAVDLFVTNLEKKNKVNKLLNKRIEKERVDKKREEMRRIRDMERIKLKKQLTNNRKIIKKTTINRLVDLKENNRRLSKEFEFRTSKETDYRKSKEIEYRKSKENEFLKSKEISLNDQLKSKDFSIQIVDKNLNSLDNSKVQNNQESHLLLKKRKEIEEKVSAGYQTNISKAAFHSIIQIVIIVILSILILTPITDDELYDLDDTFSYILFCKLINNYWLVFGDNVEEIQQIIHSLIHNNSDPFYPIIEITYNNTLLWRNESIDDSLFRLEERGYSFTSNGLTQIIYSNKNQVNISAIVNLCRTIYAIFVLSYMAVGLLKDLKKYVLKPLEVMIDLVENVARDPINMKNIESLKNKVKNSMDRLKMNYRRGQAGSLNNNNNINQSSEIECAEYEIKVIQLAIVKISALLAIGFGEAGGEILRENMISQEGLNPMLPGKRKCAIFGFCDIRSFQEINVALQENTMVFVNEIAEIVHSCVDKFSGSANKNIGEAFLTVWKFPHLEGQMESEDTYIDPMVELGLSDPQLNSLTADQAVLGYLNIIKNINKNNKILSYKNNPEIIYHLGEKFKVQMGFGLHVGWAIEGPIGSFYKIDCSYLSPNVNISARLEGLTRLYGVSILISGELYDLLSIDLKNICLLIDIVTVKGSVTPIRIYTIYTNDKLKPGKIKRKEMSMKEMRRFYENKKEQLKTEFENSKYGSIVKIALNKKGFKELLVDKKRPILFYEKFREGFNNYIQGDWKKAYRFLKDAFILDSTDGPTKTLLNYIKKNNRESPYDWKGYRELTTKT